MIAAALLSAIHRLTLALGLGGIVARGRSRRRWTPLPNFSVETYHRINAAET